MHQVEIAMTARHANTFRVTQRAILYPIQALAQAAHRMLRVPQALQFAMQFVSCGYLLLPQVFTERFHLLQGIDARAQLARRLSNQEVLGSVALPQNVIPLAEVQRSQRLTHPVYLAPVMHQVEITMTARDANTFRVTQRAILYPIQAFAQAAHRMLRVPQALQFAMQFVSCGYLLLPQVFT